MVHSIGIEIDMYNNIVTPFNPNPMQIKLCSVLLRTLDERKQACEQSEYKPVDALS